ncbi:MAG: hypothetical protein EB020_12515, partial [Proteobacteria bacterium]|nr:hypothetical protein [Pseudomonadota bacterium]
MATAAKKPAAAAKPKKPVVADATRARKLVIVESPAKAKTIEKFLGRGYSVKASLGHVRDLPKRRLGVDIDEEFAPSYVVPKEKKDLVKELTLLARGASELLLATDPDREGEAIAWHLLQAVQAKGKPPILARRVVFHEITKTAVQDALKHPREIDLNLAWQFASEDEFGFADLARDYFDPGQAPSPVQQAGALMALQEAPHYFRRAGKGRFKKAPAE